MRRLCNLTVRRGAGRASGRRGGDADRPRLVLRAVRFYRADQDLTRVKGIVQIPYSAGPADRAGWATPTPSPSAWRMRAGWSSTTQSWQTKVCGRGRRPKTPTPSRSSTSRWPRAPTGSKWRWAIRPADGRPRKTVNLEALGKTARASDLLASPAIRLAAANDTVPKPGEFRAGNNLVTAAARVVLTPLRSHVYYLMEAYAPSEQGGKMGVAIRDSAGKRDRGDTAARRDRRAGRQHAEGSARPDRPSARRLHHDVDAPARAARPSSGRPRSPWRGLTQTLVRDSAAGTRPGSPTRATSPPWRAEQLDQAKEPLAYVAKAASCPPGTRT